MSLVVRSATVGDAEAIARVHIASWRETYTRLLPRGALDDLDAAARAERWTEIIGPDVTEVWVAEMRGTIISWASASSGREADAPRDRELEGIYVLAAAPSGGAGTDLLDAALGARQG